MFAIRHIEEESGTVRDFLVHRVEPIGLAELNEFATSGKRSFPTKATVSQIADQASRPLKVDFTVEFNEAIPQLGLVPGGVLPAPYLTDATILLDLNAVVALERCDGPDRVDGPGERFAFSFLDSHALTINPMMAAFVEAAHSTWDTFRSAVERAEAAARKRLPSARVVSFPPDVLARLFAWRQELDTKANREALFLRKIAPRLARVLPKGELQRAEHFVLQAADAAGIRRLSVVILAALARVYGDVNGPADRVLKLSKASWMGDDWERVANNALADVRQISLMNAAASMPGRHALLTADLGLSMLWCGISRPRATPGEPFDPKLFPHLKSTTAELRERIQATGTQLE